ncbi:transmembrane protein, putative (macronuclear) [Tetrahymena thermophila SB210]|uniref:Transmembrane protein, putative n=1 Tax=Tetrahymena thermophila (strain SB210) TaxID=312017 RepID=W7XC16_TETTS|nr:transmembrane protein, putative [Tetrahymena thermophila SB210]EWS73998.1 transmembrane protein, putative [Tetrahymena thermophila SB210]|eukprot:XP_012653460.1 transmembrane protein, putative [Tetrahymena thermophila SB210]
MIYNISCLFIIINFIINFIYYTFFLNHLYQIYFILFQGDLYFLSLFNSFQFQLGQQISSHILHALSVVASILAYPQQPQLTPSEFLIVKVFPSQAVTKTYWYFVSQLFFLEQQLVEIISLSISYDIKSSKLEQFILTATGYQKISLFKLSQPDQTEKPVMLKTDSDLLSIGQIYFYATQYTSEQSTIPQSNANQQASTKLPPKQLSYFGVQSRICYSDKLSYEQFYEYLFKTFKYSVLGFSSKDQ